MTKAVMMLLIAGLSWSSLESQALVRDQNMAGDYIVESPQVEMSREWVNRLDGMRAKVVPWLGLPPISTHRTLIRFVGSLPHAERVRFHGWVSEGKLDFFLEVTQPLDGERFLREVSKIFIYEKILPRDKVWKDGEKLPEIPFWLIEGVCQRVQPQDEAVLEMVVRRQVTLQKAPSLVSIMDWKELSLHPFEAEIQRSFAYALLLWNSTEPLKREKFWSKLGSDYRGWIDADREEMQGRWERYLSDFKTQTGPIMSWDETQRAVSQLLVLAVPEKSSEEEKTVLLRWDELESFKPRSLLLPVIFQRAQDLMLLEAQAHFAWRSFIFDYRAALQVLLAELQTPPPKKSNAFPRSSASSPSVVSSQKISYQSVVDRAKQELESVQQRSSGVTDYLDWFMITNTSDQDRFSFEDYYQKVGEMKRTEPRGNDPYRQQSIRLERMGE